MSAENKFTFPKEMLSLVNTTLSLAASTSELSTENKSKILQNYIKHMQPRPILTYSAEKPRNCNFEIRSLPERRIENVAALVKILFRIISLKIKNTDLVTCRRVAKMNKRSQQPRNILVTMSTPELRDAIVSAARVYNLQHPEPINSQMFNISGKKYAIYITEHYAPEVKVLYGMARARGKMLGYKHVWIKYDRVYVRKADNSPVICVNSEEELNGLC